MKNKIVGIVLFSIFIMICCHSVVYGNSEYRITDYHIDATLQRNGNLHMEEYLTYSFSEDMNGVYRDILYAYRYKNQPEKMEPNAKIYQASDVSQIQVFVSDTGFESMTPYIKKPETTLKLGNSEVFSVTSLTKDGKRKNIKVYSPVESGNKKYIKYSYDIEDVAVKYLDAGEMYWNFLGKDWEVPIHNLTIRLVIEGIEDMTTTKVYPHAYTDLETTIQKESITITGKDVSVAVDARVVFDESALGAVTKTVDENYSFSALEEQETKMTKQKDMYTLSNTITGIIFVVSFIFAGICFYLSFRSLTVKLKKEKLIDYYHEPLDKLSLIEYNMIANGRYSGLTSNIILAIILDLCDKKYLLLDARKKAKKASEKYDYFVKINPEKNIADLTEEEIKVINMVFNQELTDITKIEDMKETEIELNESFKKFGNSYRLQREYQKYVSSNNKKYQEKIYATNTQNSIKLFHTGFFIMAAVMIINLCFISPLIFDLKMENVMVTIVIGVFYYLISSVVINVNQYYLKEEYHEEYEHLIGLKKYLKDYSKIKERYPIEIVLWNQYLVFATLFGIADKVGKELKEELLEKGYEDSDIYINYPLVHMTIYSTSLVNTITTSTGSSSSGGYSGGGSGGGGRRRWRWWRILTIIMRGENKKI